jgi:hypothetical protein
MFMPENTQAVGLCSTCNNSPTCFHRASRGPALLCELFDDYVAVSPRSDGQHTPSAVFSKLAFRGASDDSSQHGGLCVNCENHSNCWHAKPEGGVWHCEGYE